ncbi:MAG: DNA replication/repair protein RecF [Alphaproteobacteria bacterium]|nr:MAG: DNA replication/repair protein RecF [Alphaproteobacteria bacterium]
MAVLRLVLGRFRSHAATRLEVDARPVVLFGPNGAGKTNLLEAISQLVPGRGLRGAPPEEMARAPGAEGWKIAALVQGAGAGATARHEVETGWRPGAGRWTVLDGKSASRTALAAELRILWLTPAMDRLFTEGAEGRRRFLDRAALGLFPGHAEAAARYERAMRERNRLLREGVADPRWHEALERAMAEAGAALIRGREAAVARLAEAQPAGGPFPRAALRLVAGEGGAEARDAPALAAALAAGRARDLAAGRTLIGPHRDDLAVAMAETGMPAARCSTGEQKALLISLVLANARAIRADAGAAPVLLLDEVAAHLDAGRRAALYDEILALGAQAWMTGTGPELFAGLGARAQGFAVSRGEDGASRLAPAPLAAEGGA